MVRYFLVVFEVLGGSCGGRMLILRQRNLSKRCLLRFVCLRPDFTSKLVHVLAFGTPKFYIAHYDKIKHKIVNLSSNCDVKSGLSI